jgi:hypothetical protein
MLVLPRLNHCINASIMKTVYVPGVIDATYLHDYFIHIVFSNGKEGNIDLQPFIGQGVFEPLINKACFKKLFVDGWTISWPNGADVAPETLYELTEQGGIMVK